MDKRLEFLGFECKLLTSGNCSSTLSCDCCYLFEHMKRLEHFLAISFRLKGCDVDFGTFLPIKFFEHFDTLKILCHLHFKVRSALQGQIRSTAKGQIRSTAKGQIRSTAKCNLAKLKAGRRSLSSLSSPKFFHFFPSISPNGAEVFACMIHAINV